MFRYAGLLDPLLHQKMMGLRGRAALGCRRGAVHHRPGRKQYMNEALVARLKKIKVPVVVVINKAPVRDRRDQWLVHGWKKHLQPHAVSTARLGHQR